MKSSNNGKVFFYYILVYFSLLSTSLGISKIVFAYIDRMLNINQDLGYFSYEMYNLQNAISSLIIGIPVLFISSLLIQNGIKKNTIEPDNTIRRWMVYILLALSSIIFLSLLVVIVNGFLSGKSEIGQFLKLLTVLVIAGVILGYYLLDLSQPISFGHPFKRLVNYLLMTIMILILVSGFFVIPSNKMMRELNADRDNVTKIQKISYSIDRYYRNEKKFPKSLNVLVEDNELSKEQITDIETGDEYTYKILSPRYYEICANFYHESKDKYSPIWSHESGKQCFKLKQND